MSKRIAIYPKDIANLFGKSEKTGQRWLAKVRAQLNKPETAIVTVQEFCQVHKIKVDFVQPHIQ